MKNLRTDHVAFPSFNAAETHVFYTQVMGFSLIHAQSSKSASWDREYLLTSYAIGDGRTIAFFEFDGIQKPPKNNLPEDIYHVGLAAASGQDINQWKERFKTHGIPFTIENHGNSDHLYFHDPNGVLFEMTTEEDSLKESAMPPEEAVKVVEEWSKKRIRKFLKSLGSSS
jgi:glyoxylase I family protein